MFEYLDDAARDTVQAGGPKQADVAARAASLQRRSAVMVVAASLTVVGAGSVTGLAFVDGARPTLPGTTRAMLPVDAVTPEAPPSGPGGAGPSTRSHAPRARLTGAGDAAASPVSRATLHLAGTARDLVSTSPARFDRAAPLVYRHGHVLRTSSSATGVPSPSGNGSGGTPTGPVTSGGNTGGVDTGGTTGTGVDPTPPGGDPGGGTGGVDPGTGTPDPGTGGTGTDPGAGDPAGP
jgi:hypothetical protein